MKISDIKISNRHRKTLGDIRALMDSMKDVGLLHAVVLDSDNKLIAGERRVAAAKMLGWGDIDAHVVTGLDEIAKHLRAERDENTCREPFTPIEAALMADDLAPYEKKAAKERQEESRANRGENFTARSDESKGRSADKVAEAVGMSRPTLDKAKAVMKAAKADPANYGDLPEKMDTTRKVDPVHREMLERAEKFPIPDGPTPAQIARNSAAVKWIKNIHECWVVLNSIRDNGGAAKLTASWTEDERRNYVTELKEFRDAANEWISILEKSCSKRKIA